MTEDTTAGDETTLDFYAEGYDKKFNKYYQIFKFPNIHGEWSKVAILSDEVASSEAALFKKLAQAGFIVPNTSKSRSGLLNMLEKKRLENTLNTPPVLDVTEQIGWLFGENLQFVLPNKIYGYSSNEVLLQGKQLPSDSFCISGSLQDWQSNVLASCNENSNLMFSVAMAFAPPLMRLMNIESGGFQFVGRSSIGKTTSLRVATSVWGKAVATWNTTIHKLGSKAIVYNDALLAIDETGQSIDQKEILKAIYQLAGGQGRERLTDDNGRYSWRIIFLSTSESSLDELAKKTNLKLMDGQRARLVDIGAEISNELGAFETIHDYAEPKMFADKLNEFSAQYHGAAGDEYLEQLIKWVARDKAGLQAWLKNKMNYYNRQAGINLNAGIEGRIAERFAIVYAAGRLASEFGIIPWKYKALLEAVNACHKRVLLAEESGVSKNNADKSPPIRNEDCIMRVRSYIAKNRASFDRYKPEAKFSAAGLEASKGIVYKTQKGKFEYLFTPKLFEHAVCREYPVNQVIKSLRAHGLLLGKEGENSQRPLVKNKSTTRVIAISAKIRVFGKT